MKGTLDFMETQDFCISKDGRYYSKKLGTWYETHILNCEPTDGGYMIDCHGLVTKKEYINIGKVPYVSFWDKYPDAFVQLRTVFNLPKCWRDKFGRVECYGILAYMQQGLFTGFRYNGNFFRYSSLYDKLFFDDNGKYVEREDKKLHFYMRELYNVRSEEIYEL